MYLAALCLAAWMRWYRGIWRLFFFFYPFRCLFVSSLLFPCFFFFIYLCFFLYFSFLFTLFLFVWWPWIIIVSPLPRDLVQNHTTRRKKTFKFRNEVSRIRLWTLAFWMPCVGPADLITRTILLRQCCRPVGSPELWNTGLRLVRLGFLI